MANKGSVHHIPARNVTGRPSVKENRPNGTNRDAFHRKIGHVVRPGVGPREKALPSRAKPLAWVEAFCALDRGFTAYAKLVMPDQQHLAQLLAKAIKLDRATKGNIQVVASGHLKIIAQIGFDEPFLRHFETVAAFDSSACGRVFGTGNWVMIPDILQDAAFIPHREVAAASDVRSVKSIPITAPSGYGIVGVLSTHSPRVRWDWERDNTRHIADELGALLSAPRYSERT